MSACAAIIPGPAMSPAFHQKVLHAAFLRRCKEQLSSIRVVKVNDIGRASGLLHKGGFLKVA
jgi:hypothetical protein